MSNYPTRQLQIVRKTKNYVWGNNLFIVVDESNNINEKDIIQVCNLQELKSALEEGRDPECVYYQKNDFEVVTEGENS